MITGGADGSLVARRMRTKLKQWALLLACAVLVLVVDQLSKAGVVASLGLYEQWAPIPALESLFTFTLTHNTGGAFSILPQAGSLLKLIGFVMVAVILYYAVKLPNGEWAQRAALGILLGGALGNLVDRLRLGYVVDFLHVHGLPVFNVADVGIVGGVGLLLLLTWWQARQAALIEADLEGRA